MQRSSARAVASSQSVPMSATARLRALVLVENDLEALVDLFASAVAEDGIGGHFCIGRGGEPLVGDAPALVERPEGAIVVECDNVRAVGRVVLAPLSRPLDPAALARVRGFSLLYAARAAVLLEKRIDHETACGLSLCERYTLARLLAGESLAAIAEALDRSVAAVMGHVEDAVKALGAKDRTEAVAIAARRGWLMVTVNEISALSLKNRGYIPDRAQLVGPGGRVNVASRNAGKSRALS